MALLPLEKLLASNCSDKSKFPSITVDYWAQYIGLLNYLKTTIYPSIDVGLAINSKDVGFYTAHSQEHFDEVIRYAGQLLKVESSDASSKLEPYEIYVLLIAIRIHDAGNIYGRDGHERQCFKVLKDCGNIIGLEDTEKRFIASIAEAHGGVVGNGDKDTISKLPESTPHKTNRVRSRLIASIVRFADEICENSGRAANHLLVEGKLPSHSEIFHRYAAAIKANSISGQRLEIQYEISIEDAMRTWEYTKNGSLTNAYLIDVIYDRLEKMDRERRYCNRFSKEVYTIDEIRATIVIVKVTSYSYDSVQTIGVELLDAGYPDETPGHIGKRYPNNSGAKVHETLRQLQSETST